MVTTRSLRFEKGNLWVNAAGPEPKVTMRGTGPGNPVIAREALTRGWSPGIYQQVIWLEATGEAGTANHGTCMQSLTGERSIEITLPARAKLYALRYE